MDNGPMVRILLAPEDARKLKGLAKQAVETLGKMNLEEGEKETAEAHKDSMERIAAAVGAGQRRFSNRRLK